VADLQESPAVEPEDEGGNARFGMQIAGAIGIFVGWGLGVFLNLLLHASARGGSRVVGWVRIYPTLGPYAWSVLLVGLFTGLFGVALLWASRESRSGPVVLPGTTY
jgi:hypothetical protein